MKKIQSFLSFLLIGTILFTIACKSGQQKGSITLPKTEFAPGEQIVIKFSAEGNFGPNAWIGIIPSSTPHGDETKNDEFDVSYQYFEATPAGELTFTAPEQEGDFDFRMNTTDQEGVEVFSIPFKVVAPKVEISLTTDKAEYQPGENIVVTFTAPFKMMERGWIGLIPSDIPHGNEDVNDEHDVSYQYMRSQNNGTITLVAPDQTGSWDVRMNDSDESGTEVKSITITVK